MKTLTDLTDEEFKRLLDFAIWVCEDIGVTGNLCAVELLAQYRATQPERPEQE